MSKDTTRTWPREMGTQVRLEPDPVLLTLMPNCIFGRALSLSLEYRGSSQGIEFPLSGQRVWSVEGEGGLPDIGLRSILSKTT